ncbi:MULTISPECIES: pheST operon leader peptide PheM [Yersinia]|nr:pheST operon leader peptide PheM [Yersinia aleksiciae]QKJ05364.1 pheST operon leader peptide PheM [Yersinia mollaretii ATCC 43969]HDL6962909.1 pheST operon leader peptide PheM [Yersinia enterocolitica]
MMHTVTFRFFFYFSA